MGMRDLLNLNEVITMPHQKHVTYNLFEIIPDFLALVIHLSLDILNPSLNPDSC